MWLLQTFAHFTKCIRTVTSILALFALSLTDSRIFLAVGAVNILHLTTDITL